MRAKASELGAGGTWSERRKVEDRPLKVGTSSMSGMGDGFERRRSTRDAYGTSLFSMSLESPRLGRECLSEAHASLEEEDASGIHMERSPLPSEPVFERTERVLRAQRQPH